MPRPITQNTLFYGDNPPIVRKHITDDQTFKQAEKFKKSTGKQENLL